MEQKMFCYQCQETAGCRGCTMVGVCGKQPDVAAMQDLLVYVSRGISAVTTALRKEGKTVAPEINHLITLNLFTTITNANFDRESIEARIRATLEAKAQLGYIPEMPAVYDLLTVEEHLEFIRRAYKVEDEAYTNRLLERLVTVAQQSAIVQDPARRVVTPA